MNISQVIKSFGGEVGSALSAVASGKKTSVFGLTVSDARLFCCGLDRFVYVAPDTLSARNAFVEFSLHFPNAVLLLPKSNVILASGASESKRVKTLYDIASGAADVVVTTAEAVMQLIPTRKSILDNTVIIKKGEKYITGELITFLVKAGYTRVGHIDDICQFSIRGDILDVCCSGGEAARIEFFGYDCDGIRSLDISTQIAGNPLESFTVYPARECCAVTDDIIGRLSSAAKKRVGAAIPIESRMAERVSGGVYDGMQSLISLFPSTTIDEFCDMPIIIEDAKKVYDNCVFAYREHAARSKRLIDANEAPFCALDNLVSAPRTKGAVLCFHSIDSANRFFEPDKVFKFKSIDLPLYTKSLSCLPDDIATWRARGMRVLIAADIRQGLTSRGIFELSDKERDAGFSPAQTDLSKNDELKNPMLGVEYIDQTADGGVFFDANTVIIGMRNVGMKRDPFESVKRTGMKELPKPGDYVVHEVHGIGICEAVGAVTFNGYERDYITIKYAGGDELFVPVENMSRLSKYNFGDETPRLNKLGGAEFDKVKTKVKSKLKQTAFDLVSLYAKRETIQAKKYPVCDELFDEFSADFPYTETPDQQAAIDDCLKDLTSGRIMDRLICGDVGFGKTEVALRAAFKVISGGGQVAFMSPTTVLTHQHYATTLKRMQKFGVKVGTLSRMEKDQSETLQGIADGTIDIVCGTHRLLSKDVKFKNLELLILDEEQKFGVNAKEKIKNLKNNINVLTLSATPIPRTLHMALSGIRDVSMLETPPPGRLPAQVYVTEYSDALAVDAITREVERGGQAFVVYNYVNTNFGIAEYAGKLQSLMPKVKVAYAHGQMEKGKLSQVVDDFASGKSDVLVATTIIENGIDIPNANTMIVYGAENMGLSQLYQLKGRVGRSDRVAQAYFTYSSEANLSGNALDRLESIGRYTDLGSGVKIAEQDMRIRGVGNVFGAEQHGHIVSVGYDMYCKLLNEAIAEIKGNAVKQKRDTIMKVDFTAVIPKNYCDSAMRLDIYNKISNLKSLKEKDELLNQLKDAFEVVPQEIKNLALVGLIKNLASSLNATTVTLLKSGAKMEFESVMDVPAGFEKYAALTAKKVPILVFDSVKTLVSFLTKE